ncbi:MAG: histidine phosphatase family protein [Candidatus Nanopelagicales bacterium]|nr:histidine phosphatase family protein [Candidatus Nanopelagicales bacterium]
MAERTVVHLLRHGEVHNPEGILYGRLPGFHLSELGQRMAQRVASTVKDRDIVLVKASPLERAQETAAPIAAVRGLEVKTDPDLIEGENVFEGMRVSVGEVARHPRLLRYLWNPLRPSWGEPYVDMAARMRVAIDRARIEASGHEALVVSHQLPIWVARLDAEHRRFAHDPRHRQCSLASVTSLEFDQDALTAIIYTEPAADLTARASKGAGA